MPIAIVIIGVIIAIAAWNNSFPALATELESDVPGYLKWGFAIAAILALGYIPGMKTPSRWILAIAVTAYVLANWQAFQSAFQNLASSMQSGTATAQGSGSPAPTAAYSAAFAPSSAVAASGAPAGGTAVASQGSGSSSPYVTATAAASQAVTAAQNLAANPLNPNSYVGLFSGFGGLA